MKTKISDLTEKQKENARRAGLTLREACEILDDAITEARLDRQAYESASPEEKDAHDNL